MKIMYPDYVSSVSAVSFDADYPADNLLDEHPSKPWKSESWNDSSIVTAVTTISSALFPVSGVFIGGTNASTGSVVVWNETETVEYESHALAAGYGQFFVKFTNTYTEVLHILVTLTSPTAPVYAGVLRAGSFTIDMPDPQYGLKMQRVDYSIKKELSNGGLYVFNRNMPRQYDLSFMITHDWFTTLDALYWANGSHPLAMLLSDNINSDDQWSGFFHMVDPPSGGHEYLTHTSCGLTVKEAV